MGSCRFRSMQLAVPQCAAGGSAVCNWRFRSMLLFDKHQRYMSAIQHTHWKAMYCCHASSKLFSAARGTHTDTDAHTHTHTQMRTYTHMIQRARRMTLTSPS